MEKYEAIERFKHEVLPAMGEKIYNSLEEEDFGDFAKRLGADLDSVSKTDTTITLTLHSENDYEPNASPSSFTFYVIIDRKTGNITTNAYPYPNNFVLEKWQYFLFKYYHDIFSVLPDFVQNTF